MHDLPAAILIAVVLAACGGEGRSTLGRRPPRRARLRPSNHPQVDADATIHTTGTAARTRIRHARLFTQTGGDGVQIVLEPTALFAPDLGRRRLVSAISTGTLRSGCEILASHVTRLDR